MKSVCYLLLILLSVDTVAQSEEETVLRDWENIQRSYPQTTTFNKLEEKKYYIENESFYEGNIIIKNIIIEESEGYFKKTADIVVTLDKSEKDLYKEKGHSYTRWGETNRLVFDAKKARWLRYKDLSYDSPPRKKKCNKNTSKKPLWEKLFVASFPVLIIILVFYIFARLANKGVRNINERVVESNEKIAKELKRIADLIDKQS